MKYGLIGEHLGHSFSKVIHEQLENNYLYDLHEITPKDLDAFMKEKAFTAINVTIPYKQDVIPYLDDIDEHAKAIGAVNTIVNTNGKLKGYNTDYLGFAYTLEVHHIDIFDKKVIVMGNGGASKAIQAVIRNKQAKEMLIVDLLQNEHTTALSDVYRDHLDADIIINTTPVGMYPNVDAQAIDLTTFKKIEAVVDVVYNPLRTNLILDAQDKGIKAVGGLEMLVSQAIFAYEFFKATSVDKQRIDEIYKSLLLSMSNIAIIGMPGSGKTTISEILSKELHKTYVDIDGLIVEEIQMPIADYFKQEGEQAFRNKEMSITKEKGLLNNQIISCGGGIVKHKENIKNLKRNALIFCVERDLEKLISDDTRPLSSSKEAVYKLYEERKDLYKTYQEFRIVNNTSIEEAVKETIKIYKEQIGMFYK